MTPVACKTQLISTRTAFMLVCVLATHMRSSTAAAVIATTELLASDGAQYDQFGNTAALDDSGTIAMVGSMPAAGLTNDIGALYMYARNGSVWSETAKLMAPGAQFVDEQIGWSAAMSGDGRVAFLAGNFVWVNNTPAQGAVYAFVRGSEGWNSNITGQTVLATDGGATDMFGYSIATNVDGSVLLVGAVDAASWCGAAYFFHGNRSADGGMQWTQTQRVTAPYCSDTCLFGYGVALDSTGTIGVVTQADCNFTSIVYMLGSDGVWAQTQILTPSDPQPMDLYGPAAAVVLDRVLVVGSMWHTVGKHGAQGVAYVYTWNGTAWDDEYILAASDGQAGDCFGSAMDISPDGNVLVVGANNRAPLGAAYVFRRNGTGSGAWVQQEIVPPNPGNLNNTVLFGVSTSVSAAGDVLLIGASQSNVGATTCQGDAFVFKL